VVAKKKKPPRGRRHTEKSSRQLGNALNVSGNIVDTPIQKAFTSDCHAFTIPRKGVFYWYLVFGQQLASLFVGRFIVA